MHETYEITAPILNIKCIICGRFIGHNQLQEGGGARFEYTPETEHDREACDWICKKCNETSI